MPSVNIPDKVFERLAKQAADLNLTVDQLIVPLLEGATEADTNGLPPSSRFPNEVPFDDWKKEFDGWMAEVQARAHLYPQGFKLDDSRESIYEGCGQ